MRIFTSIRFRLILLVLLAILPLAGMSVYRIQEDRRSAGEQTAAEALNLARLTAISQQTLVDQGQQLLFTLAQLDVVRAGDPAACNVLLARLLPNHPYYTNILVVNPDARPRCSAIPFSGAVNYADRDWFERAMQTRAFTIGSFVIGRITGKPSLPMAYPILDRHGQPQAMVVIALDLGWVSAMPAELDLPPGSTVTLVDTQGNVLGRYPDPENWLGKDVGAVPLIQHLLVQQAEGTIEDAGLDGVLRLYGYVPVQNGEQIWGYLFIGIPSQVAYAASDQTWKNSLIAFGLVAALALAAAWALGEFSIIRRTQALVRTAKRLAAGDQSVRTGMRYGAGEISQLERAFDEMAETLQRRETERKRAEEEIRSRAAEFAELYDTAGEIAARRDLPALLKTIVERARGLLKSSSAAIFLYDEASRELELAVTSGFQLAIGTRLKIGEGMAGRVAQSHEPLIVDDYRHWDGRSPLYEDTHMSASLQVPMLVGGDLLGVLDVSQIGDTTRRFTGQDARLLLLLAGQAASAVHNTRLFNETHRRADEFFALYETNAALSAEYDLNALLQAIVERAAALLGATAGGMYLYHPASEELEVVVATNPSIPIGKRLHFGEGVAGRVAQTRQPLRLEDYSKWEGRSPKYEGIPVRATIELPMLYQGELIGVLVVHETGASERKFTEADEHLLSLFASQAAGAVRNAGLLDKTRARAEQLALLYDAGLTLNRTLEPRLQLELLCTIATKALHADNTSFFLYDAARNDLHLEFGVGLVYENEVLRDARFPLGAERGLIGWVAQNRAPLNLSDVTADPRWIVTDPAIRSALWVPVLHDEQLLGVLSASSAHVNAFTSQDERLFVLFANQVAVAMENARLFDETRQRLAELEAVHNVSATLRTVQTRDEALPILLDETLGALETDVGAIWLYHTDSGGLHLAADRGWFGQLDDMAIKPGEGIAGMVFASGQAHRSTEFARDPLALPLQAGEIPAGWGGVCLPIRTGAITVGVLFVSVPLPRQITSEQMKLLESLTEMAGTTLHRISLHEETVRQLDQLQSLHNIDLAITASMDLRVTLNILLEHVTTQLNVDAADVLLFNPHLQMLEYAAGCGFRGRAVERTHFRIGEGQAGLAALERRIIQHPDFAASGITFAQAELPAAENIAAYFAVPLIAKGEVKGVLEVFHLAIFHPGLEWLNFLETLAGHAAIVIDSAQLFEDLQRSNTDLESAYEATIEGWSHALDLRDKETEGHTLRVTEITLRLAKAMGIGDAELVNVRHGALLHDIGKMGVPDSILLKPGKLTDEEWVLMRKHPVFAHELLSPIAYLHPALDIPYCHHEKWDGTGYPRGLKGEAIPLSARIFAVVDVWDALLSDRPYRKAWSKKKVRKHIQLHAGTHFDPNVVPVFLRLMD